ncbi:MAG: hypothetical protein WD426_01825 [Anditalea sp.]
MKKVIILLLLAISFVVMTLISWMKFQTTIYFQSNQSPWEYQVEDSNRIHSKYMMGFRLFVPLDEKAVKF